MARPKTKDYRIVPLSLDVNVIELMDKLRGDKSRTEFIEMLIKNSRDRIELIRQNERLTEKIKELEKIIEEMNAKLKILEEKEREVESISKTLDIYDRLIKVYVEAYHNKYILLDKPRRTQATVYDLAQESKKILEEIDNIQLVEELINRVLRNHLGVHSKLKLGGNNA